MACKVIRDLLRSIRPVASKPKQTARGGADLLDAAPLSHPARRPSSTRDPPHPSRVGRLVRVKQLRRSWRGTTHIWHRHEIGRLSGRGRRRRRVERRGCLSRVPRSSGSGLVADLNGRRTNSGLREPRRIGRRLQVVLLLLLLRLLLKLLLLLMRMGMLKKMWSWRLSGRARVLCVSIRRGRRRTGWRSDISSRRARPRTLNRRGRWRWGWNRAAANRARERRKARSSSVALRRGGETAATPRRSERRRRRGQTTDLIAAFDGRGGRRAGARGRWTRLRRRCCCRRRPRWFRRQTRMQRARFPRTLFAVFPLSRTIWSSPSTNNRRFPSMPLPIRTSPATATATAAGQGRRPAPASATSARTDLAQGFPREARFGTIVRGSARRARAPSRRRSSIVTHRCRRGVHAPTPERLRRRLAKPPETVGSAACTASSGDSGRARRRAERESARGPQTRFDGDGGVRLRRADDTPAGGDDRSFREAHQVTRVRVCARRC